MVFTTLPHGEMISGPIFRRNRAVLFNCRIVSVRGGSIRSMAQSSCSLHWEQVRLRGVHQLMEVDFVGSRRLSFVRGQIRLRSVTSFGPYKLWKVIRLGDCWE